jgi:hypothetical protein
MICIIYAKMTNVLLLSKVKALWTRLISYLNMIENSLSIHPDGKINS